MALRRLTILAALFFMTGLLHAQTATNLTVSSVTASWLDLSSSARVEGMGEAFVAVADDVNTMGVNPAGFGRINDAQLSLTHNSYVQGSDIEQGVGSVPLGPGSLAFGLTYANFGKVQEYTVAGGVPVEAGYYVPSDWKIDLGYGFVLIPDLYAGLSGKFLIDNTYINQITGWAGDAGLLWTPKGSGFGFGLSALNIGSLSGAAIPTEIRGGGSYQFDVKNEQRDHQTMLISFDALARTQDFTSNREAVGLEYWYHDHLALRMGQQLMDTTGLSGWSGFSIGVGLKIEKIQIDYTFATRGDLGNFNLVSLVTGF
jgi:hypothetical protein